MSSSNTASKVIPMRESDRPGPQPDAHFGRLLQDCQHLAIDRLSESIAGMLDKADEALRELSGSNPDREARELHGKARDKILAQRRVIEERFREHLLGEFERRIGHDAKGGDKFSQYDASSLELGLVTDDDLDETLKVNNMAAKLRGYCEDELAALDQRVGVLLGDATLEADANPFNPQTICQAYKQTCRDVEPDLKVRMVLHKLFDDHVLDDVRSIYRDLNALLVQNSILPKIRYTAARRADAAPGTPGAAPGAPGADATAGALPQTASAAPSAGSGQDFFAVLQNLLASSAAARPGVMPAMLPQGMPAAPAGAEVPQIPGFPPILGAGAVPVMLQGAELLGSLTRLQQGDISAVAGAGEPLAATLVQPGTANVLRELKQTSVGSGMGQMDAMTLDIVAMLFDEILDDARVPAVMKGLIGRLQIPMLKVALIDKSFFSQRDHPARLLLDALGEIGLGLPHGFDDESQLYLEIDAVLHKLIDGFRDDIGIFEEARKELERVTAEQNQRVEEETARLAKSIEEKEKLEVAKVAAQSEITQRVASTKLPRSVRKFLAEQWVKLLLVAHAKNGTESPLWKSAIATMDLLIWSVNPSKSPAERRQLATKLPGLLKRLNAGMHVIGIDKPTRTQIFLKLMRCHTQIINSTDAAAPAATPPPAPAQAAPPHEPAAAGSAPAPQPAPAKPAHAAATPTPAQPIPATAAPPAAATRAPAAARPTATPSASAPASPAPATAPAATPPPGPAQSNTATSAPVATSGSEDGDASLDFTEIAAPKFSSVVIKNPFGDGEIEVEEINVAELSGGKGGGAGAGATHPIDEHVRLARRLQQGAWVEFRGEHDTWQPARLSYISPLRTTYLFVDRQGNKVGEYSLHQLAREFRNARANVLDAVPLFDRAMTGLMSVLKGAPAKQ